MAIRKRDGCWHVDFSVKGAGRIRETTGLADTEANRAAAQEWHDKYKSDIWHRVRHGERPKKSWNQAVLQWAKEKSHKKSFKDDLAMIKWLDAELRGKQLEDISRSLVDHILDIKEAESSPSRANRYAALIRSILRKAERVWTEGRHYWLEKAPAIRMREEPVHVIRWMTKAEAKILLAELPDHLADAVQFTLQTGLREQNCAGMRWSQIDMEKAHAWIQGNQAKGKRPFGVPLNSIAMDILRYRKRNNRQGVYVFEYRGVPLSRFNNHSYRKAKERAMIKIAKLHCGHLPERLEGFNWHALRHTWASWHVQEGTRLERLQELGGWATLDQVQAYAHLAPEHMVWDAERIVPKKERLRVVR